MQNTEAMLTFYRKLGFEIANRRFRYMTVRR